MEIVQIYPSIDKIFLDMKNEKFKCLQVSLVIQDNHNQVNDIYIYISVKCVDFFFLGLKSDFKSLN